MGKRKSSPARIWRALDTGVLAAVCELPETDFGRTYDMQTCEVEQKKPYDFFHFRDNGSSILAVAHLDTVMPAERRGAHFADTEAGPVIFSGALDDRLGAYIILELLPSLGVTFDWLLTTGEERGQSTAKLFGSPKDYNWIIEFDRGGTDVVMYQYESPETRALVRASGATVGDGLLSDISYMEDVGIKAFNWGTGYRDYHGPRSHAYLADTVTMVGHFLRFHQANKNLVMPHEKKPRPAWTGGRAWFVWDDCELCKAKYAVDPKTNYCSRCGFCLDCLEQKDNCQCFLPEAAKDAPEKVAQAAADAAADMAAEKICETGQPATEPAAGDATRPMLPAASQPS